jgi:hypothetical protein
MIKVYWFVDRYDDPKNRRGLVSTRFDTKAAAEAYARASGGRVRVPYEVAKSDFAAKLFVEFAR